MTTTATPMPATWREQQGEILLRQFRFCSAAYRHADAEQKRNPTVATSRTQRLCREAMVKAAEELRRHQDPVVAVQKRGDTALYLFDVLKRSVDRQFGSQNAAAYNRRYSSPWRTPPAMPKR